ncbi:RNA exonuclease 1 homolog isoform X1 [Entelurus aequoreus]|uniref:RNA exonuclease 1 homolog isoform X1 n=1 Tax=Entelurus aequoreus TaxID=161455 RepID=UPI002B1D9A47|nr:RNA exonuclease 1 homolog isoform X1 [Entelurus aequoreus]
MAHANAVPPADQEDLLQVSTARKSRPEGYKSGVEDASRFGQTRSSSVQTPARVQRAMFPSSGRFVRLTCPFTGRCQRPHCWYKHAKAESLPGASSSSSPLLVDLTGDQNDDRPAVRGAHVINEPSDESLQELERINKAIETAKYEVEREQRRLSCYHTAEAAAASRPVAANGVNSSKVSYSCSDGNKTPSRLGKYVVDISKPRTDLEYDPMSNFSADFGSYKSSYKAQKGKRVHLKPLNHQVPPCRPVTLDDAHDDSVLIIDVPCSPERKPAPAPKRAGCDADKKQHKEKSADECEASAGSVIDLTGCVEDPGGQSPEAASLQSAEDECCTSEEETQNANSAEQVIKPTEYNTAQPSSPTGTCTDACNTADCHQAPEEEAVSTSLESSSLAACEHLLSKGGSREVIVIDSSADEEENGYSAVDLSDSDPEEECYRIFMEAKESGDQEQPEIEPMDVAKPDIPTVKPQELPAKRRIAHKAEDTELPVAKRRPQPLVLVPLRGPTPAFTASQLAAAPKIQQIQQKASMLTASVKGGQSFLSSIGPRKPESPLTASVPVAVNTPPAAQHNKTVNYVPLGSAVLNVGNNLRLILPQGTIPLTSACSVVSSVLTPITRVHTSSVTVRPPTFTSPAVLSTPRYRAGAPLLIPPAARRPFQPSVSSLLSTAASSTNGQAATKPVASKRKGKAQGEASRDKVPHDVRQRYVTMFMEAFLATTTNVNEAFEKALAEEKALYNRSSNKLKYLSVAVNVLKRLKKPVAAKDEDKVNSKTHKGNIPLNRKKLRGNDDTSLYEILRDYILTEEQLIESNYPVQHPQKAGCAVLFADNKKGNNDPFKRICCRCGATYSVGKTGKHTRTEECNYHYGKGVENRVPGGVETRYSCCQGVMGAPGCQLFKLHVHDSFSLEGFKWTVPKSPTDVSCPGIYALDCEMCYTIHGRELSRVTVVNSSLQVVYDTFVKPHNEVIDYNTRFSGISEKEMRGNHTSLSDVQKTLLSFISADTVIIGHGLQTGLCALKLLHGTVVDTSVVFPHRLGPPHRLTLNSLTAEYLRRIIQESVCGHDTAEDAAACMELMLLKSKDGKVKK